MKNSRNKHKKTLRKNILTQFNIPESNLDNDGKKNKSIINHIPIVISLYSFIENHSDKIKSVWEYFFS